MIAGVVLAAGASSRLGRPKQLVEVGGRPLVVHAAECCAAGGCGQVRFVLGASLEPIRAVLDDPSVDVVVNESWAEGIGSSIRAGVSALPDDVEAVVLVTCDQPRLSSDLIRRLIAAYDGAPRTMVACEYAGTLGVPALFGAGRFEELRGLRGDRGARHLLRETGAEVVTVRWPDGAFDVDRPRDLDEI